MNDEEFCDDGTYGEFENDREAPDIGDVHMGSRVIYVDETTKGVRARPLNAERIAILCHLFEKFNGRGFIDPDHRVAQDKALRAIVTIQGSMGDVWMNNFALSPHFVIMLTYRPASFNSNYVCYTIGMDMLVDENVKLVVNTMTHIGDELRVTAGGVTVCVEVPGLNDIFDGAKELSEDVTIGSGAWQLTETVRPATDSAYEVIPDGLYEYD